MAKRRAANDILIASPKKCRGICSVDLRLESVASSGESTPPLLTLLRSRCSKRPFYFDETGDFDFDMAHFRKSAQGDLQKNHDLDTVHQQTSGNVQNPRNSTYSKSTNKRARNEEPADTSISEATDKVDAKKHNEDSIFNSFQFWRIPLPELDMSLLQEPPNKDSSSEEMET